MVFFIFVVVFTFSKIRSGSIWMICPTFHDSIAKLTESIAKEYRFSFRNVNNYTYLQLNFVLRAPTSLPKYLKSNSVRCWPSKRHSTKQYWLIGRALLPKRKRIFVFSRTLNCTRIHNVFCYCFRLFFGMSNCCGVSWFVFPYMLYIADMYNLLLFPLCAYTVFFIYNTFSCSLKLFFSVSYVLNLLIVLVLLCVLEWLGNNTYFFSLSFSVLTVPLVLFSSLRSFFYVRWNKVNKHPFTYRIAHSTHKSPHQCIWNGTKSAKTQDGAAERKKRRKD